MNKRKIVALLTAAVMTVSMVFALPVTQAEAKTKYEVPVKVTGYYNRSMSDNAEWEKGTSVKYKYDKKGYITYSTEGKVTWAIKKNKPVTVKTGSKSLGWVSNGTYKKGNLKSVSIKMYNDKGKVEAKSTEKYTYKKKWISKISGNFDGEKYTVTYTYKERYKSGMPKTVVEKFTVSGSSYKTTYSFNKKGLLTSAKSKNSDLTYKYKYDKKGRVIESITYDEGYPVYRYVYKYDGKTAKNKKTYMSVLNFPDVKGLFKDVRPSAYPLLMTSGG